MHGTYVKKCIQGTNFILLTKIFDIISLVGICVVRQSSFVSESATIFECWWQISLDSHFHFMESREQKQFYNLDRRVFHLEFGSNCVKGFPDHPHRLYNLWIIDYDFTDIPKDYLSVIESRTINIIVNFLLVFFIERRIKFEFRIWITNETIISRRGDRFSKLKGSFTKFRHQHPK